MWSEWRWRSHLPRLTLAVPLKHISFSVHSSNTKRRGQESPTSYLFHPKTARQLAIVSSQRHDFAARSSTQAEAPSTSTSAHTAIPAVLSVKH